MSQKKINGYVIHLKDVLGKGSYGMVSIPRNRFIMENKMAPKRNVQLRSWKKV